MRGENEKRGWCRGLGRVVGLGFEFRRQMQNGDKMSGKNRVHQGKTRVTPKMKTPKLTIKQRRKHGKNRSYQGKSRVTGIRAKTLLATKQQKKIVGKDGTQGKSRVTTKREESKDDDKRRLTASCNDNGERRNKRYTREKPCNLKRKLAGMKQ